jgi:hypothetical protein
MITREPRRDFSRPPSFGCRGLFVLLPQAAIAHAHGRRFASFPETPGADGGMGRHPQFEGLVTGDICGEARDQSTVAEPTGAERRSSYLERRDGSKRADMRAQTPWE